MGSHARGVSLAFTAAHSTRWGTVLHPHQWRIEIERVYHPDAPTVDGRNMLGAMQGIFHEDVDLNELIGGVEATNEVLIEWIRNRFPDVSMIYVEHAGLYARWVR